MTPGPRCGSNQALDGRVGIKGRGARDCLPGRAIMPDELGQADEVFLTGTAAEVTPVGEIDEHHYQVGPITRTLIEDYDKIVRQPEAAAPAA